MNIIAQLQAKKTSIKHLARLGLLTQEELSFLKANGILREGPRKDPGKVHHRRGC
jgi:hypothetical protein